MFRKARLLVRIARSSNPSEPHVLHPWSRVPGVRFSLPLEALLLLSLRHAAATALLDVAVLRRMAAAASPKPTIIKLHCSGSGTSASAVIVRV